MYVSTRATNTGAKHLNLLLPLFSLSPFIASGILKSSPAAEMRSLLELITAGLYSGNAPLLDLWNPGFEPRSGLSFRFLQI